MVDADRLQKRFGLPEGTVNVGVGLVVAGVTAYAFIIVAKHALGTGAYGPLGVLWAAVFTAGPGLFLPLEQEVSRVLAERRARAVGTGPVVRRAALLGGILAAVVTVALLIASPVLVDELFDGQWLLLAGLLLGMVGYYAGHLARGTFSGLGRFNRYSVYISAEGVVRLLVCVAFAVIGVETAGPYGLALGLAPIVAVALAVRGERGLITPGPDASWAELSTALWSLLAGNVMAQGLPNAGVPAVQLLAHEEQSEAVGRFFIAVVISRVPLFLFQAVQAALLPRLSGLAGAGQIDEFRVGFRRLALVVGLLAAIAVIGAYFVGQPVIKLLFGEDTVIDRRTLVLLAGASGVYMVAVAMTQAVIALGGHARMAVCWTLGVATFIGVTALGDELFLRVEVGLFAGSAMAAACLALAALAALRSGASVEVGDLIEAIHEVPPLEP